MRVHGTVLSVSLVHCLFQGKNLCAAGEHELHTGWIMNKRTTCRRTGTLRIRHEVLGAANGNTWKGLTGRGLGCPPPFAMSCGALRSAAWQILWFHLGSPHIVFEARGVWATRDTRQATRQGSARVHACVWVCVCVYGSGKCVFQFHLICLSTQSEISESN